VAVGIRGGAATSGDLVLVAHLEKVVPILNFRGEDFQVGFPFDLFDQALLVVDFVVVRSQTNRKRKQSNR